MKEDGGPAFPTRVIDHYESVSKDGNVHEAIPIYKEVPGMTLRDYFAIHASEKDVEDYQGYKPSSGQTYSLNPTYSRDEARYRYANAMIKVRSK